MSKISATSTVKTLFTANAFEIKGIDFYLTDFLHIIKPLENFFEKSCKKIWRVSEKCVTLHRF